jgi:FixJ family two-component response regulator
MSYGINPIEAVWALGITSRLVSVPETNQVPLIAIVHSGDSFCKAIEDLIRSLGCRSLTFDSGLEFLASHEKQEVACLILDLEMRGLSGPDVHNGLVQMGYLIPPTIFLFRNDNELCERALRQGAMAVLRKTSTGEDLLIAIQSALKSPGQ